MTVVMPHRMIEKVSEAADPKKAILDSVGDLSAVHILGDQVIIGTYFRPKKTAGGIIRPDANVEEDMWQGKVGLVLKIGPEAFIDTDDYAYIYDSAGPVKVGDWVVYKIGDTWKLQLNEYPCSVVRCDNIKLKIDNPNMAF